MNWEDIAALDWPIQDDPYVTQPFGYDPDYVWNDDRTHYGVDFGTHQSSVAVYAPLEGKVIFAGIDPNTGYGLMVKVQHADGTITLYAHLSSVNVEVGQSVLGNQQIAMSGGGNGDERDGTSTGWHLHFAVMQDGKWIDGLKWLETTNPEGVVDNPDSANPSSDPQPNPQTTSDPWAPDPFHFPSNFGWDPGFAFPNTGSSMSPTASLMQSTYGGGFSGGFDPTQALLNTTFGSQQQGADPITAMLRSIGLA